MIFDMHTHSSHSACSILDIRDMVDEAGELGLDGICITDHHTMAGQQDIPEGRQPNGVVVIFGMEYSTADGDFLIFGPYENIRPGMDALTLLSLVNSSGGAAVAAHPFRQIAPVSEALIQNGNCRIAECINGRNSEAENWKTDRWRKRYGVSETGGSDAHTPGEMGSAATCISIPVATRQDLVSALNHGLCRPVVPAPPIAHVPL